MKSLLFDSPAIDEESPKLMLCFLLFGLLFTSLFILCSMRDTYSFFFFLLLYFLIYKGSSPLNVFLGLLCLTERLSFKFIFSVFLTNGVIGLSNLISNLFFLYSLLVISTEILMDCFTSFLSGFLLFVIIFIGVYLGFRVVLKIFISNGFFFFDVGCIFFI